MITGNIGGHKWVSGKQCENIGLMACLRPNQTETITLEVKERTGEKLAELCKNDVP